MARHKMTPSGPVPFTPEEEAEWDAMEAAEAARYKGPMTVSPRQIRQALTRANLRTQVEAAVAAGDQDLKDWWEFATTFERNHPMVVQMGTALGQTAEQMDQLFITAVGL
jgi:hypothetical protein